MADHTAIQELEDDLVKLRSDVAEIRREASHRVRAAAHQARERWENWDNRWAWVGAAAVTLAGAAVLTWWLRRD